MTATGPSISRAGPGVQEFPEVVEVLGLQRHQARGQGVDQGEELLELDDPVRHRLKPGLVPGKLDGAFQDDQGGVEFPALPLPEDPSEQGPDVTLGPVILAALALAVDLMDDAPGDQLAEVHADIAARDPEPLAEILGGPVVARDVEQGEELAHGRIDPPRPGHDSPMLDELPDQLRRSRVIRKRGFGGGGIIVEGMIHRAGRQNMDSVWRR